MSTLDRTGAEIARGIHDMGGLPAGMVRPTEHDYEPWEKRVDALLVLLSHKSRSLLTVDELRRNIEAIGPGAYDRLAYYERWMHAITQTLIQRGVITIEQLSHRMADVEARNARGEL
jgi:hypothetical protein